MEQPGISATSAVGAMRTLFSKMPPAGWFAISVRVCRRLPVVLSARRAFEDRVNSGNYPAMLSVRRDIFAVRSIFSQLNGRPSIARLTVLNSTTEKTWR